MAIDSAVTMKRILRFAIGLLVNVFILFILVKVFAFGFSFAYANRILCSKDKTWNI